MHVILAAIFIDPHVAGAKIKGAVTVSELLTNPTYTADLNLPRFNPRKVIAALGQGRK